MGEQLYRPTQLQVLCSLYHFACGDNSDKYGDNIPGLSEYR